MYFGNSIQGHSKRLETFDNTFTFCVHCLKATVAKYLHLINIRELQSTCQRHSVHFLNYLWSYNFFKCVQHLLRTLYTGCPNQISLILRHYYSWQKGRKQEKIIKIDYSTHKGFNKKSVHFGVYSFSAQHTLRAVSFHFLNFMGIFCVPNSAIVLVNFVTDMKCCLRRKKYPIEEIIFILDPR